MPSLHYQGPLRDNALERLSQTPRELASQGMGPVLTMLALLECRASCTPLDHTSQDMAPMLTILSLRVYPLHLHMNLEREAVFHDDFTTLVLHTLVEISLVVRISL